MRNATTLIVLGITLTIACSVLVFGYRMLNHADNFVSDKTDETAVTVSTLEFVRYNEYNNKTLGANQVEAAINRWGNQLNVTIVDGWTSYSALTSLPDNFDAFAQYESTLSINGNGDVIGLVFKKL